VLPSLYIAADKPWSVRRAAVYGAAMGLVAALFKSFVPLHQTLTTTQSSLAENLVAKLPEIAAATLAFALLCAGASALRNFVAQNLIWRRDA